MAVRGKNSVAIYHFCTPHPNLLPCLTVGRRKGRRGVFLNIVNKLMNIYNSQSYLPSGRCFRRNDKRNTEIKKDGVGMKE